MPINKGYFDKHVVIMIFLLRLPGDTIRVVGNIVFWRTVCGWEQFFFLILGEYMTFPMIL